MYSTEIFMNLNTPQFSVQMLHFILVLFNGSMLKSIHMFPGMMRQKMWKKEKSYKKWIKKKRFLQMDGYFY